MQRRISMSRINYIEDLSAWQKDFEFYYPVKVRFSETDLFGHLNNTVPFTYFEEGRIEFFKNRGLMADWLDEGGESIIVVADLQCDFLKQVFFDEHLKIHVKADSVGNSSVDIHYMATREDNDICFVGRGTVVQISKATGRGIPWTDEIKKSLGIKEEILV